jgi:hypothetical protein
VIARMWHNQTPTVKADYYLYFSSAGRYRTTVAPRETLPPTHLAVTVAVATGHRGHRRCGHLAHPISSVELERL